MYIYGNRLHTIYHFHITKVNCTVGQPPLDKRLQSDVFHCSPCWRAPQQVMFPALCGLLAKPLQLWLLITCRNSSLALARENSGLLSVRANLMHRIQRWGANIFEASGFNFCPGRIIDDAQQTNSWRHQNNNNRCGWSLAAKPLLFTKSWSCRCFGIRQKNHFSLSQWPRPLLSLWPRGGNMRLQAFAKQIRTTVHYTILFHNEIKNKLMFYSAGR